MADPTKSERLRRLEEDVNQRVREAFGGLREQIAERLRRLSDEALEALEGLREGESPAVLAAADLEPLAREAEDAAGRRAGDEIVAALAAIDRAGSQGEVLSALAREAARFAARTAVLLTRPAGAELWAAEGWDRLPSSLAFGYPEAAAWAPGEFGRGAVELTGDAAGELARRLDADPPAGAVLVPLVLRDRLAAVLYADAGGEEAAPAGAPLQALTWAASQALESLPFRQRAATPTLAGLDAGPPADEAPPLWGGEGGAAAPAAAPAEAPAHGAGRAVGIAAAGLAAAGLAAAGVARVRRERAEKAEEAEEAAGAAPAEAAGPKPPPAADRLAAFDEIVLDEGPGPEVAAPPVPGEEPPPAPAETAAVDAGWRFEDSTSLAPPPVAGVDAAAVEADVEELPEAERVAAGFGFGEEGALPLAPEPAEDTHPTAISRPGEGLAAAAAGAETAAAEAAEETYPGFAATPPPPAAAPPVAAPPVAPPPAAGAGAEVAPPPDLQGPGRAFAGRGEPAADEEQARHEEARRLARLLVSEIRLYNEEEVEAGRRHGDVYERLKEDIDRSRQLYEERVDPRVREGTDYFYQELVRNLGGGDARALGI